MPAPQERQARSGEPEGASVVSEVVHSAAFTSFLRSAGTVLGRELTRRLFGTARRRRR